VLGYAFDETSGKLTPAGVPHLALPPGSGPRHFAFHPEGKHVFVINEMLSTIAVARYEAGRGAGEILSVVSTLPEEHQGESTTAEILAHPSGRFVYGSNRGHDSIAVFRFDAAKGALDRVELESTQGKTPRNFGIHPSGKWLVAANQDSNSVVVFRIDEATGALSPAGQTIEVGRPVCVRFL
jgi:6-phosphogluconolactonase